MIDNLRKMLGLMMIVRFWNSVRDLFKKLCSEY